jgi:hypothetical protein
MKYTLKADKLELDFEVDPSFVEALLGAVRAAKNPSTFRVYTPYPEETEGEGSPDTYDAGKWYDHGKEPIFEDAEGPHQEVDRTETSYGKWYSFILMWLVNFDREGEQPERGEKTRALAHSRYAGKVVKLVRELGGTTHATYDAIEAAFKNNESARLDGLSDKDRKSLARQVAENITQVSSILFADLSDLLEYHNPLEEEEV